jgi:hypothetical protein
MNSPVTLTDLRQCDLSKPLGDLEVAAANFIHSFAWSGTVLEMYEGFQEPEILGVFLIHLRPAAPDVDEWLWVVVGDVPPAYLVADDNPTVAEAVDGYIREMQRWVEAAREGRPVDALIPVNVPPTQEFAEMLASRLKVMQGTVLDVIRTRAAHAKASLVQAHRRRAPP